MCEVLHVAVAAKHVFGCPRLPDSVRYSVAALVNNLHVFLSIETDHCPSRGDRVFDKW